MSGGEPSQSEKGMGDRGEIGDGRREESEDGDGDESVGTERRGGYALSDWISFFIPHSSLLRIPSFITFSAHPSSLCVIA
jgi:hypothetical protein